jgi:hypothetical protein
MESLIFTGPILFLKEYLFINQTTVQEEHIKYKIIR